MFLHGKVAIVTGACSGIGRETSIQFAKAGATVIVSGINNNPSCKEVVDFIRNIGGEAVFIKADVTDDYEVRNLIQEVIVRYGTFHCAFNNAGICGTPGVLTGDYQEEEWDKVININLKGVWLLMKYELQHFMKTGNGVIVNTSSTAGLQGSRIAGSAYSASKFGIVGLTKTAALEYAQKGIRINAVCPGIIETKMSKTLIERGPMSEEQLINSHPMKRFGSVKEVAEVVTWLCSDSASFITGHALAVDGGILA